MKIVLVNEDIEDLDLVDIAYIAYMNIDENNYYTNNYDIHVDDMGEITVDVKNEIGESYNVYKVR